MGNGIYFKIAGWVDLDILHIFVKRKVLKFYKFDEKRAWKPNLVRIITRVSSVKIVSGDAVHQPTWPLLLKIEHMVKLQVYSF
jgi:hypothetical protein